MNKTISIALATYNGERFLREQLDSLCAQTHKPSELVVSDDNSSDGTLGIVDEYKTLLNIKVLTHSIKQGVNRNFETAIRACSGDYIMICDQDDVWMPEKIEITFKYMLQMEQQVGEEKPILVSTEKRNFSKSENIKTRSGSCNGIITGFNNHFFSREPHCQGCLMMFNRPMLNTLKEFPANFKEFTYDGYIAFVANIVGYRCYVNQVMMNYRIHGNNVIGGTISELTGLQWLKEKLPILAYQLFGCPSKRLYQYESIYPYYDKDIRDIIRHQTINKSIQYNHCRNIIKKSYIVFTMNGFSVGVKIKYLLLLWLTIPFRLLYKQPH